MKVRNSDWNRFIQRLSKLNNAASDAMQKYIDQHGLDDVDALIDYASALSRKYGEAGATLSCLMYDAVAEAQRAAVAAAVPAAVASPSEVRDMVYAVLQESPSTLAVSTGRYVRQAAADTMLQNARRDHAEQAFVPFGETCAYCIALGSRGWEPTSSKNTDHAAHIHPNCDCMYMVRFTADSGVAGYNPERYKKIYYSAAPDGNSYDKINALRRGQYAENKDKINEQKRKAYAARTEAEDE